MKAKKIFLTAVAIVISATQVSFGQVFMNVNEATNTINTLTTANLKGNIESVKITSYYASEENDKIIKGNKNTDDLYEYNTNGLLTYHNEEIILNDKGMTAETHLWSGGEVTKKTMFIYDSNNKCIGKKEYDMSNTLLSTSKCVTDATGNILRELTTTTNAEANNIKNYTSANVYTYSPEGIRTSFANKETSGAVFLSYTYELDDKSNPIKEVMWDEMAGESTITFKYTKFDEVGNWIECVKDKGYEKEILVREIKYYDKE